MKTRKGHAGTKAARGRAKPAPAAAQPLAPLPLRHPAALLVLLVAVAVLVVTLTFDVYDADQWQHLTVGRYIWEQHRLPTSQLWTWPTYGDPEVNYAWGFEALVWPFWKLGGLLGLYAWRWLTALVVFGLAWATARRMGAKGLVPFVVISLCVVIYRARSQVRPETVAAVLLAAEIWLLEARRHGGRFHPAWLVLIAWVWANTHISYYLFFVVLGIHALAAVLPPRQRGAPPARGLWLAGLAGAAAMFVNPWGWRTLWQPVEFWLVWRHEPIYRAIGELGGVRWRYNWLNGLPLLLALWPVLIAARTRRWGFDRVEAMMCAVFSASLLVGARFMGVFAVVAGVYVSRDLDEWVRVMRRPRWAALPWARAGFAAIACLAVAWPEVSHSIYPIRIHFPANRFPVAASDFVRRHDLHGRLFNQYDYGGYLGFRFWPRRDQLPFMGIHQEGSKDLRLLYMLALARPEYWRLLDERYRFDYAVLGRSTFPHDNVLAFVDRDTAWTRVFGDDAACVYVRNRGPFAGLARDSAYRVIPADPSRLRVFDALVARDPALRRQAERELWREVAGSPWHATALDALAGIALLEGRWDDARRELEAALRIESRTPGARERLGIVALRQGRPLEALRWFEEERRMGGFRQGLELRRGQVAQAQGDPRRALACYRRELARDAGNAEARDSLESISRRLAGR